MAGKKSCSREGSSLQEVSIFLRRLPGFGSIDGAALESEVYDLLRSTGILRETEEERLFHEAAALEPDARALARRFQDLSVAPDPLTLLWDEPNLRGPLLALARARGAARLGVTLDAGVGGRSGPAWSQLSDKDQRTIRALAGHLARYHSSLVPVSRPRQAIIDTALFGLAEIFARNDGFAGDVMDLPHAAGSRFIGFCRSVLRDHVHPTHCSPTALARRWQRLKRLQQDGLRPSSRRR